MTPDPPGFIPQNWEASLVFDMIERQKRWDDMMDRSRGIDPDNRETVIRSFPKPDAEISARAAFKERWDALIAEGEAAGYFEREACYECGGELKVSSETEDWRSVPNPDYDPDKPKPEPFEVKFAYSAEGLTVTVPKGEIDNL